MDWWSGLMTREIDDGDTSELTIVLADDEVATRAGLRRALEPNGMRVVAEVANAAGAVGAALKLRPDVCVLAVRMPGNGIAAARQISRALPATKIVMLAASERHDDLIAAIRAGAHGYLLKTMSAACLPNAIRGVVHGEAAVSRAMTMRLIQEFREGGRRRRLQLSVLDEGVVLTAREFEVLERLRNRERTAEIAADLGISEVTVRRHISAILHKLGTPNRRSAIELLERTELHRLRIDTPAVNSQPAA
jgi:DNA-binding NarL/FixJ family response regulator